LIAHVKGMIMRKHSVYRDVCHLSSSSVHTQLDMHFSTEAC